MANSTARRLMTGSAPGRPRQTGQTLVLGAEPNSLGQPQKDFGIRAELDVNFEADYGFVFGAQGLVDHGAGGHQFIVRTKSVLA